MHLNASFVCGFGELTCSGAAHTWTCKHKDLNIFFDICLKHFTNNSTNVTVDLENSCICFFISRWIFTGKEINICNWANFINQWKNKTFCGFWNKFRKSKNVTNVSVQNTSLLGKSQLFNSHNNYGLEITNDQKMTCLCIMASDALVLSLCLNSFFDACSPFPSSFVSLNSTLPVNASSLSPHSSLYHNPLMSARNFHENKICLPFISTPSLGIIYM